MNPANKTHSSVISEPISFLESFLDAEMDLFSRKIGDVPYWHTIRFYVFQEMLSAKGWFKTCDRRANASVWNVVSIAFSLIRNSLWYPVERDDHETPLLVLNSPNRVKEGEKYIDLFTDIWLEELSHAYSIWETPLLWKHQKHGTKGNLFYLDSLHLRALFHRIVRPKSKVLFHEARTVQAFAKELGVDLKIAQVSTLMHLVVSQYHACRSIIERQLRKKRVQVIVLVNHYDPMKMMIAGIAKTLGIHVVELQHGTMGRYHVAYNFSHSTPLPGLPDEIFTFGRFWNETTGLSRNKVKLTTVGLPKYDRALQNMPKTEPSEKTRILFISQETIGSELAKTAVQLAERLDSQNFEILFKLHPREWDLWEKMYPQLSGSKVTVVSRVDIYELMRSTDIHVGVYSTVVIESLAFGKRLILMELPGVHYVSDLLESGRALLARDVEELLVAINAPPQENFTDPNLDYYWEPNSREKVIARVEELLGEG